MGHEERFPPLRLSDGRGFRKRSFAGYETNRATGLEKLYTAARKRSLEVGVLVPHTLTRRGLMNKAKLLAAVAALGLWVLPSDAASLTPDDAGNHVGQNATVCDVVAQTNFDADTQFWPTFLDFGKPYPNQVFTAVIYGVDRAKFGTPGTTLQGKRVCVTGSVREYRGKPEIILNDPIQLTQ
jgi:hypothetical protein